MVLIQDKDTPPQYEDVMGPQRMSPQVPTPEVDGIPVREVSPPASMPSPNVPPQTNPYPPAPGSTPQQQSPYVSMQSPQAILNPEAQIGYNYQHEREFPIC